MVALPLLIVGLVTAGCKRDGLDQQETITGAGATFPAPLYEQWIARYAVQTRSKVIYRAVGSGRGIDAIVTESVDFAGSDSPMSDEQLTSVGFHKEELLQIPMTLGAIAVVYNAKGAKSGLKLTPELIAEIYLGKVTDWSDPRITSLNGSALPAGQIKPLHRKDASGTTDLFTTYLAGNSKEFADAVGSGIEVQWPGGYRALGNKGVAMSVRRYEGTIGYVSLAYAKAHRLDVATIRNKAGQFVAPTVESITAAAEASAGQPDLRTPIVDATGAESYPISAYSFVLVRKEGKAEVKRRAVAQFLWWGLHEGQRFGPRYHYARLPDAIVDRGEKLLKLMKGGDKQLL